MAKVAWIGLGVMGYPMAGHILRKGGHDLVVYNRSAAKAEAWVAEHGAGRSAPTPAAAAAEADFVFACVGNDDDLRTVTLAKDGAFAGCGPGRCSSTTRPLPPTSRANSTPPHARAASISSMRRSRAGRRAPRTACSPSCAAATPSPSRARFPSCPTTRASSRIGRRRRPAHQDGQPDLHRRPRPGARRRHPLRAEGRPRRRRRHGHDLQGRGAVLADGEPLADDGGGQVRLRLRRRLDAQGSRDLRGGGRRNGASLPVAALVDQFYAEVQRMGGGRWDTSSLVARLAGPPRQAPTGDHRAPARQLGSTASPPSRAKLNGSAGVLHLLHREGGGHLGDLDAGDELLVERVVGAMSGTTTRSR